MKAITDWIHQPRDQIVFKKAVNKITQQVICPLVPDIVRDILVEYRTLCNSSMFEQMYAYEVDGIDNWEEVVEAFNTARRRYDKFLATLTEGNVFV